MKRILTSLVLVASVYSFAQVSISGKADDAPQATLDIKAIDGKTNGILVPRISRKAADNMAKPADKSGGIESAIIESTLIYINDISGEVPTNYATGVDTKGFYYFKDDKWVKLGGESANSSINLSKAKGNIRPLPLPVGEKEFKNDDFAVKVTGPASDENMVVNLPNPGTSLDKDNHPRDFTNRILSINNQGGGIITFKGDHVPVNMTRLNGGAGFLLMSDGTKWYVIGGLF